MEKKQQILIHVEKAQWMRMVDIFLLGPGLILMGATKTRLDRGSRFILMVTGGLTIAYNLNNFLMQRKFIEKYQAEEVENG